MTCTIKKCNREESIFYYHNPVCEHHWLLHCKEDGRFNLKKRLKIEEESQLTLR